MLDRWSSDTVTIVWEFGWADSVLVILGEFLSCRGGCLNRFDCNMKIHSRNFSDQNNCEQSVQSAVSFVILVPL